MDLDHERRLTEVEERAKSNSHRLCEVERRQDNLDELVGTVKVLAIREKQVEDDVREIKGDVKSLTGKPGERWEMLITQIITLLCAAIVGFILAKLGVGV